MATMVMHFLLSSSTTYLHQLTLVPKGGWWDKVERILGSVTGELISLRSFWPPNCCSEWKTATFNALMIVMNLLNCLDPQWLGYYIWCDSRTARCCLLSHIVSSWQAWQIISQHGRNWSDAILLCNTSWLAGCWVLLPSLTVLLQTVSIG